MFRSNWCCGPCAHVSELPVGCSRPSSDGRLGADAGIFQRTVDPHLDADETPIARPFPFHLAHQIDFEPGDLGDISDWQAEWKWDGIRAQVIKRSRARFLCGRAAKTLSPKGFPEIAKAASALPDGTVLDGEVLPWLGERVLPFTELQRRIGRRIFRRKFSRRFLSFCSATICSNSKVGTFARSISNAPRTSREFARHP